MEIKEITWNRFYIPIQPKEKENEMSFLERSRLCLSAFYEKYTANSKKERDEKNPFKMDYTKEQLDKLKGEWVKWDCGHLNLSLEEGLDIYHGAGDIEFFVGTPQDNYGHVGIEFLCTTQWPDLKPKMEALKSKWKDFQYAPR
jgi:hypothetical protein